MYNNKSYFQISNNSAFKKYIPSNIDKIENIKSTTNNNNIVENIILIKKKNY